MEEEDISTEQPEERWFVDLDWFQRNNRSFSVLLRGHLCPACKQRLTARTSEIIASDLLETISGCCSRAPDFIHGEMPILESIFRLLLSNKNQPLDLESLSRQLSERRGGDNYRTLPQMLSRLLKSDRYYGLCQYVD